jgi:hypothetical protein
MSMPDLYAMTVPVFIRAFKNLDHVLAKAEGSGIAEEELFGARLIEDMLPLAKQVQIASDTARFASVRVGLAQPSGMADEEATSPSCANVSPGPSPISKRSIPPVLPVVKAPRSSSSCPMAN